MHTVYCSHIDLDSPSIIVSDQDEIHHMKNVLRISAGEEVLIVNDKNQSGTGVIENIKRDSATLRIVSFQNALPTKPYLILACAIPKKSKFETIIEKATELGADEIIPLLTERTEVKPASQSKKDNRYKTIAVNAVKQSKRSTIPVIKQPQKFSVALKELLSRGPVIMPSLEGKRVPLRDSLQNAPQSL
jgi:16S rRNA (uracil1498-N3)-methyltransferase